MIDFTAALNKQLSMSKIFPALREMLSDGVVVVSCFRVRVKGCGRGVVDRTAGSVPLKSIHIISLAVSNPSTPGSHAQSGSSFRARTDVSPCLPSPAPPPPDPDFEPTDVSENQIVTADIVVFPNPSGGKFFVSYRGEEKIRSIRIANSFGGSAYGSFDPVGSINEINLQHAASGLYFVEVVTESQKFLEKVLIAK